MNRVNLLPTFHPEGLTVGSLIEILQRYPKEGEVWMMTGPWTSSIVTSTSIIGRDSIVFSCDVMDVGKE